MSCCFFQLRAMDCGDLTRHKLLGIYCEYTKTCRHHQGAEPPEWGAANSNGNRRDRSQLSWAIFLKRRNYLPRCPPLLKPWLRSGSWERTMGESLRRLNSKGQGSGWLELSEMTEQPNYDWETFVNKADSALAQQAKHFSPLWQETASVTTNILFS